MLQTTLIDNYLVRENCNGADKLMHFEVVAVYVKDGQLKIAYLADEKIVVREADALHVIKRRAPVEDRVTLINPSTGLPTFLSETVCRKVRDATAHSDKYTAISFIRMELECGLKEAKEIYEANTKEWNRQ